MVTGTRFTIPLLLAVTAALAVRSIAADDAPPHSPSPSYIIDALTPVQVLVQDKQESKLTPLPDPLRKKEPAPDPPKLLERREFTPPLFPAPSGFAGPSGVLPVDPLSQPDPRVDI